MNDVKILVVDDDDGVVSVLKLLLTNEGFRVTTAASADQGLDALKKDNPDIIILDLRMPGMSGIGFINKITGPDGRPKYPVLVLTAHANMSDFFKDVDVDGFLLKPFRSDVLLSEINRIVSARRDGWSPKPSVAGRKKKKALIAEDDDDLRSVLADAFSHAGYDVEHVGNGNDAVGKAILAGPDVLIINAVLTGLNGGKVASLLRSMEKTMRLPIILYERGGVRNSTNDALLASGAINAYVCSSEIKDLLDAAARILGVVTVASP